MTEKQFIDAVMEEIFIRGFICPPVPVISNLVQGDWQRIEESPDPTRFAERCFQFLGLTNRATNPIMGIPSTTAGRLRIGSPFTKRVMRHWRKGWHNALGRAILQRRAHRRGAI